MIIQKVYQDQSGKHIAYLNKCQNATPTCTLANVQRTEEILHRLAPHQVLHIIFQGYPPIVPEVIERTIVINRDARFGTVVMIQPNGTLNFLTSYLRKMAFRRVGYEPVNSLEEAIQHYVKRFGPNALTTPEPQEILNPEK